MVNGQITLTDAIYRAGAEKRRGQRDALRPQPCFVPDVRQLCEDFRKVLAKGQVPSVALCFADLPWDRKTLPLWDDVGRLAAQVLRDGGVLAAYPSKVELPQVLAILGKHLRFHWCLSAVHLEPFPLPKLRVLSKWQPITLFVRGSFSPPLSVLDLISPQGKERDRHPWQRPVDEFVTIIESLTRPGEWVLDLAAGSFASGKAAKLLGRNYLGIDIDPKAVTRGREWLEET
jgi:hypothetical protein